MLWYFPPSILSLSLGKLFRCDAIPFSSCNVSCAPTWTINVHIILIHRLNSYSISNSIFSLYCSRTQRARAERRRRESYSIQNSSTATLDNPFCSPVHLTTLNFFNCVVDCFMFDRGGWVWLGRVEQQQRRSRILVQEHTKIRENLFEYQGQRPNGWTGCRSHSTALDYFCQSLAVWKSGNENLCVWKFFDKWPMTYHSVFIWVKWWSSDLAVVDGVCLLLHET